jgi:hypothetical protein
MSDKKRIETYRRLCNFLDEHLEDDLSLLAWTERKDLYDELAALDKEVEENQQIMILKMQQRITLMNLSKLGI